MAGPYTHMMVCQKAAETGEVPPDLLTILDRYQCFLLLGSVSPDLPAIWDKAEEFAAKNLSGAQSHDWSSRFHDGVCKTNGVETRRLKTNKVVEHVFANLGQLTGNDADACLVWLLGHIGHIVTDVVVHPLVGMTKNQVIKSGRYQDSDPVHLQIEIVIDCLTAEREKTYDISGSRFLNWIQDVELKKNSRAFDQTLRLWADAIKASFGEEADPRFWYQTYRAAIAAVNDLPIQFRGYTYPKLPDISAQDKKDFYDQPNVPPPPPPDHRAPFSPDVFDRAVNWVRKYWGEVWQRKLQNADLTGVVPDWNLNTGENRDTRKENDLW
jgi:hypothetical protein